MKRDAATFEDDNESLDTGRDSNMDTNRVLIKPLDLKVLKKALMINDRGSSSNSRTTDHETGSGDDNEEEEDHVNALPGNNAVDDPYDPSFKFD